MDNTFAITMVFIVLSALIAAFVRRRNRDKCLKDFAANMVTIEKTDGKTIWGKLRVENTGLELIYPDKKTDENGSNKASYILYKYEYPNIEALIRYHYELSEANKRQREQELERTYHPDSVQRFKRRVLNIFKTVRDSFLEVINLLMMRAKKATPAAGVLTSQDKYVSQMKQNLIGTVGTSFEPLLERYIGHKVVLELIKADKLFEYQGVLKDYTADFIEIMDIDYKIDEQAESRKADLVVSRKFGVVRHLGE